MSNSKKTYNIGNFNLEVNYLDVDDADKKLIETGMDNNFEYSTQQNPQNKKIVFNIIKNAKALNTIRALIKNSEFEETTGYFDSPFEHYEDEESVYNYSTKDNICVVKNKADGSVSYYYDETLRENDIEKIPTSLARELIIKANMSNENYILHSASFEKNGKGFIMVGHGGAGKTSLLIAFLKSHDGVKYVSNDINFISKDGQEMFPFQIPMLLSSDTAESYFGDKVKQFGSDLEISYYHKVLQRQITKYKFPTQMVENLFNVQATNSSPISGVIIPKFGKENTGISCENLSKEEAKEIILGQILDFDDRFKVDYLNLVGREIEYDKQALAEKLSSSLKVVRINYGIDVYKEENIEQLKSILNELTSENILTTSENESEKGQTLSEYDQKVENAIMELQKVQQPAPSGKSLYELHCHTTASDGKLSPKQLVDIATRIGIKTIAITDHNTVDGSLEAQEYIKKTGKNLQVINGVEIDASDFSMFHLLAYGIKDMPKMKAYLDDLDNRNQVVYAQIVEKLQKQGIDITVEGVRKLSGKEKLQKIHIINYLRQNGFAKDRIEVQEKYLGKNCPCYVPRIQPTVQEVIDFVHSCGGICVLAHPMELSQMNLDKLPDIQTIEKLIIDLKEMGLDGVETHSPKHSSEQEKELYDFCLAHGLIQTKGNDYHGKPKQKFGSMETKFKDKVMQAISSNNLSNGE